MKPPICVVCRARLEPGDGGGLLTFRRTPEDEAWHARAAQPGFTGHPPNVAWACGPHREALAGHTELSLSEALARVRTGR